LKGLKFIAKDFQPSLQGDQEPKFQIVGPWEQWSDVKDEDKWVLLSFCFKFFDVKSCQVNTNTLSTKGLAHKVFASTALQCPVCITQSDDQGHFSFFPADLNLRGDYEHCLDPHSLL
jgi:hypothetical protein